MDIYAILKRENAKILKTTGKLVDATAGRPGERTEILNEINLFMTRRLRMEDEFLLPALAIDPDGARVAETARRERGGVVDALDDLRRRNETDPAFRYLAETLQSQLITFTEWEEKELFAAVRERIPGEQAEIFGQRAETDILP